MQRIQRELFFYYQYMRVPLFVTLMTKRIILEENELDDSQSPGRLKFVAADVSRRKLSGSDILLENQF
jgi:hypothetical protein